jgi:Icc-related predicted phosphoesterase
LSDFVDKELTTRVEKRQLPPLDLIISCGDMAPEYLMFLRNRLECPLFYVKGNHDIRYTQSNTLGCSNIHARVVSVGSLNILGLEGSMWYNGGPNQYTDKMMKKIIFWLGFQLWRKRPIHMIVTHASPRNIHDREDLCHKGFESFGRLIHKHRPDYLIHGHIHRKFDTFDDRITQVFNTRVINTFGYTIIEI